jgi:hypothetical protein
MTGAIAPRRKQGAGAPPPAPRPVPPYLIGAAIGLAILGIASGAFALGAGWAIGGATEKQR